MPEQIIEEIYNAILGGQISADGQRLSESEQQTQEYLHWIESAQNATTLKYLGLRYKG